MRCKLLSGIVCLLLWAVPCGAEPSEVVLKTIAMESASESLEGQIAVAGVIIERSRRSGRSLEAVCLAPKQFSCWNSPKWSRAWLDSYYDQKARKSALMALEMAYGKRSNPGFTHYHAIGVRPYWARGHKGVLIGNHVFYKGVK